MLTCWYLLLFIILIVVTVQCCGNSFFNSIFIQAVGPRFKFRLRFFFSFPRSVTNRRLVSKAHASPLGPASVQHMEFTEVAVVKS